MSKKLTPSERVKKWRKENPEKFRKQRREYYQKNKKKIYESRKEYMREYSKKYRSRPEVRKRERIRSKVRRLILRLEIIRLLGGKCIKCGNSDFRVLQIDHVDGNGYKDARGWGISYYRKVFKRIKEGSKKYQLLCSNCNWIKKFENDEVGRENKDEISWKEIYKLWKEGKDLSQLWKIKETKD